MQRQKDRQTIEETDRADRGKEKQTVVNHTRRGRQKPRQTDTSRGNVKQRQARPR